MLSDFENLTYDELVERLRECCRRGSSGVFFFCAEARRFGRIKLAEGRIRTLTFAGRRGRAAVLALKGIAGVKCRFTESPFRGHASFALPDTDGILAELARPTPTGRSGVLPRGESAAPAAPAPGPWEDTGPLAESDDSEDLDESAYWEMLERSGGREAEYPFDLEGSMERSILGWLDRKPEPLGSESPPGSSQGARAGSRAGERDLADLLDLVAEWLAGSSRAAAQARIADAAGVDASEPRVLHAPADRLACVPRARAGQPIRSAWGAPG